MKLAFSSLLILFLLACNGNSRKEDVVREKKEKSAETKYSYKLNYVEEVGWGYQIFDGSKMIIEQKHIPAIQGISGFDTKEKAELVAKFILDKLNRDIFPPTVSADELDSLGVL